MNEAPLPMGEQILKDFLSVNPTVEFIRLHWVDLSGILRTRFLTKDLCLRLATGESSYGIGPVCMTSTLAETEGQDVWKRLMELRPDWSSLKLCGFAIKHASIMCHVYDTKEESFCQCPRTLLARVLEQSREDGFTFLVGFEIEFVILDPSFELPQAADTLDV